MLHKQQLVLVKKFEKKYVTCKTSRKLLDGKRSKIFISGQIFRLVPGDGSHGEGINQELEFYNFTNTFSSPMVDRTCLVDTCAFL